MKNIGFTLVLLVAISSTTVQQPTFFRNNSFSKGLSAVAQKPATRNRGDIRVIYYHEQTIAVVDLSSANELLNCNILEVYEQLEADIALQNLSSIASPQKVSFWEMMKLMEKCDLLDKYREESLPSTLPPSTLDKGTEVIGSSLSAFHGIVPGTKWCGTGDIAENYHDLGSIPEIDRCCRRHDLCPVKVKAQRTRFNLTNYALYSKSHCACDEALYHCLKSTNRRAANAMGTLYFNLVKVSCVEDIPKEERVPGGPTRRFIPVQMEY